MPTFTDEKRTRVREALRETGRELFAQYGIRKTSISELTDAVGIGKGTFYQFYDSKEDLYVEILNQYREEVVPRIVEETFGAHDDPEDAIVAFLQQGMDVAESDQFFRQIIDRDELKLLTEQHLEELQAGHELDAASYLPYIEGWYAEGRVTGPDPETILGVLHAVSYLSLHVEDIGEDRYPVVRDTIIAAVAAELTGNADKTESRVGDDE